MTLEQTKQRIPAALWASLSDVCYQQDVKFLQDVSKILGIPSSDIRRRILGARGEETIVLVEKEPWWETTNCTLTVCDKGGMWRRCSNLAETNTYCWDHRKFTKASDTIRRHDDPYLNELPKRYPIRCMGEIVWVCEKGTVRKANGEMDTMRIDLRTCVAYEDGSPSGNRQSSIE